MSRRARAPRPPRLAAWLLSRMLDPGNSEYILGDLAEAYGRRRQSGALAARLWYWSQLPINARANWSRRAEPAPGRARRCASAIGGVGHDLRQTLRGFAAAPGFVAVAVATLALGIGANATMLGALYSTVLAPLPYPDVDDIVRIAPDTTVARGSMLAFEERLTSMAAVSGYAGYDLSLLSDAEPTILDGTRVSPEHFEVMGVQPFLGRSFRMDERTPGRDGVVILSHALWSARFGADPAVIGTLIPLRGGGHDQRAVIGVMPPGYRPLIGPDRDFWVPLVADAADPNLSYGKFVRLIGRLAPDTRLPQAESEAIAVAGALHAEDPDLLSEEDAAGLRVVSLHEETVAGLRRPLTLVALAALLVLLVSCGNLVHLLLGRLEERRPQLAIRRALGASRRRLAGQVLSEAGLLGLLGGVVGLLAALWLAGSLARWMPPGTPRADELAIGWEVGAAVLLGSVLAGLAAGVAPAVYAVISTRSGSRGVEGCGRSTARARRVHDTVVAAEIAFSVVLVTVAGLMLRSMDTLQRVDPGFHTDGVVSMLLSPSDADYPDGAPRAAYYDAVQERVAALPGIESAAMIHVDLMGSDNWMAGFLVDGRPLAEGESPPVANARSVTPGYFETLGIPLVTGRLLDAVDREDATPVVVINETLARRVWPDQSAVGQRIHLSRTGPPSTVVGVVGDVRQSALDEPAAAEIYRTYRQWPVGSMYLMARARGSTGNAIEAVRDAVWSVDADVPISEVSELREAVADSVAEARFLTRLVSGFAALALALGAVGVYGVMAHAVGTRRREFGVRMALGRSPAAIVRGTVAQGLGVAMVGIGIGVLASLAAGRMVQAFLYDVAADDPAARAAAVVVLGTVAVLANYVPARRAGKVDVVDALRN